MRPRVSVLIDLPPGQEFHSATLRAIDRAAAALDRDVDVRAVTTDAIDAGLVARPGDGVVVGPGSPYRNVDGVHEVIRLARERGVPLVGT
jgi:CTP synthase (UTP-ammonia lyase)